MSAPIFQHRHYVRIAAIIASMPNDSTRADVADWFARELRGTNSQYSESRFLAAANGTPSTGKDRP